MLDAQNIETLYGKIAALRGVSIEVKQGEIVSILGGNGAGKTTTLATIMGLIEDQPEKGTITFEGERIDRLDTDRVVRKGIALVPEGRQVFGELTVAENLRLGAYERRDRAGIARDLARVYEWFPRLAERKKQEAGTMSGGEQQMLAIGRGLMAAPRLLLLDEPSLGLAPVLVAEIFRIIRMINENGVTILLVEQNANMALSVAHRGYVMEGGRIVLSGTSAELRANEDIREFYLGRPHKTSVKGESRYKRKKKWQ
ncbi:ABC transporter ATP-binding protein [bacterium]|nr:ABC transporter ATP-binding protein [bacterium]